MPMQNIVIHQTYLKVKGKAIFLNLISSEASSTNHNSMIELFKVMKSLIMATKNYYTSGIDITKLLSIILSNHVVSFFIVLLHDVASYSYQGVLNGSLQSNTLQFAV